MNLEEAKQYAAKKLSEGNMSDGCTFSPDVNFTECCKMHDMLRRFRAVPRIEANNHLFSCMVEKKHPVLACIYWVFATVTLPFFKN